MNTFLVYQNICLRIVSGFLLSLNSLTWHFKVFHKYTTNVYTSICTTLFQLDLSP